MAGLPKTSRGRTTAVVVGLLVIAGGWEALALGSGETVAWSFSRWAWALSENSLFVFLCGGVCGHLFFPKTMCLHCGFKPYIRTMMSGAAFNRALLKFSASLGSPAAVTALRFDTSVEPAALQAAKRGAGLPLFTEW